MLDFETGEGSFFIAFAVRSAQGFGADDLAQII